MRPAGTSRPRIEGEREDQILDAALELLVEVGYDRLTMDAVARRARASKASLYRRWDTKQSLVVDAVVRAKHAPVMPDLDTGTLRGDLLQTFCGPTGMSDKATTGALGAVITALSTDPVFAAAFRDRFIDPKIEVTRAIYARAVARGEIRDDLDLDIIAPALAGILLHRTFVLGQPLDDDVVERVVDHVVLPAVGASPAAHAPPATAPPTTRQTTARQEARTS